MKKEIHDSRTSPKRQWPGNFGHADSTATT
jgi:hypothetical protein